MFWWRRQEAPAPSPSPSLAPAASACKISDLPLPVRTRIMEYLFKSDNSSHHNSEEAAVDSEDAMEFAGVSSSILPEILLSPALASPILSAAVAELLGSHARNLSRHITNGQLSRWLRALWPYVTAVSFHDPVLNEQISELYLGTPFWNFRLRRVPKTILRDTRDVLTTLSQSHFEIAKLDLSQVPFQYATKADAKRLQNALAACLRQNASALEELILGDCAACLNALGALCLPKLKRLEFHRIQAQFVTEERLYDEMKPNANVLNALERLKISTHDLELALNEVDLPLGENVNIAQYPHCIFDRVSSLVIHSPFGLLIGADDKVAAFISCFPNMKRLQWSGNFNAANVSLILRKCPRLKEVRWWHRMGHERDFEWHDTGVLQASELPQVFASLKEKLRTLAVRTTMTEQHFNALSANCVSLECVRLRIGPENACHLKNLLRNCRSITSVTLSSCGEDIDDQGEDENTLGEWPSYWNKLMLRAKGWEELAEAVALASPKLRQFKVLLEDSDLFGEVDVKDAVKSLVSITKSLGENAQSVCFQVPFYVGTFDMIADAMCDVLNAAIDSCQNLEVLELDFYGPSFTWEWEDEENRKEKIAAFLHALDRLKKNATKLRKLSFENFLDVFTTVDCC